jgi:hypothetical protein
LRAHPNAVPVRVMLARALLAQGKFQPAFEELRTVLKVDARTTPSALLPSLIAASYRNGSINGYSRAGAGFRPGAPAARRSGVGSGKSQRGGDRISECAPRQSLVPQASVGLAELKRSQSNSMKRSDIPRRKQLGPNLSVAYGLGACYTYKRIIHKLRLAARRWLWPRLCSRTFCPRQRYFRVDSWKTPFRS